MYSKYVLFHIFIVYNNSMILFYSIVQKNSYILLKFAFGSKLLSSILIIGWIIGEVHINEIINSELLINLSNLALMKFDKPGWNL